MFVIIKFVIDGLENKFGEIFRMWNKTLKRKIYERKEVI